MSYEVGSLYRSSCLVKDEDGNLIDPAVKVCTVTLPDQTTTTPSIVADDTGTFHADFALSQEGLYKVSWATTGPTTFKSDFLNAAVWRSVVGLDEVRDFISETDTTQDPILRRIMAAATELAEKTVGVTVQRTFTNERIPGTQKPKLRMPHTPLPNEDAITSISSVWPGGPAWDADDLVVYPDSGTCEPLNMAGFWYGPWKATYIAGRTVISEDIQMAVKEIIFDLWAIHRSLGPDTIQLGQDETVRYELLLNQYKVPPHAKMLLEGEEQPGFA